MFVHRACGDLGAGDPFGDVSTQSVRTVNVLFLSKKNNEKDCRRMFSMQTLPAVIIICHSMCYNFNFLFYAYNFVIIFRGCLSVMLFPNGYIFLRCFSLLLLSHIFIIVNYLFLVL